MATRRMLIEDLEPGMLLAEPVVVRNHVIQNSGELLTEEALKQVLTYGKLFTVSVFVPGSSEEDEESIKPDKKEGESFDDFAFGKRKLEDYSAEEKKVVVEKYVGTVSYVKNVFDMATQFGTVSMGDLMSITKSTIDGLMENYALVHVVKNLRGKDDYTYQHSVNVGILAGIIGRWLKMDEERLNTLVLSGMVHDIGKSKIPLEILNKPGKLTTEEFEIMKRHTVEGYKILSTIKGIKEELLLVALQHHERIDGSGYPFGLTAHKIHDFSRIIVVADTYDAVTTDRVYQPKRSPLAVMEILDDEMFRKMDARSSLSLLMQVRESLQDKRVILKDGEEATIIFVGKHGTDDLVVKTDRGQIINIGMKNYDREISKYIG